MGGNREVTIQIIRSQQLFRNSEKTLIHACKTLEIRSAEAARLETLSLARPVLRASLVLPGVGDRASLQGGDGGRLLVAAGQN